MLADDLEAELLANAGVYNVVLRRDEVRQLMLSSPIPEQITKTYDLRDASPPWILIRDAMLPPFHARKRGHPCDRRAGQRGAGLLIEVTIDSMPLRMAMTITGCAFWGCHL